MEDAAQSDLKAENSSNVECIEIEIPYDFYQYLRSSDCSIHNICRLCLSPQNNMMYPLNSNIEKNGLSDLLRAFTTIEIHPEEGLPFLACESCKNQVIQCYEFKLKCEKADYTLKSVLKGEFFMKNDEDLHVSPAPPTLHPADLKALDDDDKMDSQVSIKVESVTEDILYSETDMTSDHDHMEIKQNTAKRKKKTIHISETDSNDLQKVKPLKMHSYLKCSLCSKSFQKAKTLQAHMKSKHKDNKLSFPCGQCNESFNSEHDLMVHSALHSKSSTWSCNQCPKVFSAKHPLRRHIQRHMESKRYACVACGKHFVELYALRRHARVHTGEVVEKKHVCDICDKKYSESSLLSAHVSAAHLGRRPCACHCGKLFASPRLLASHRRLHSDDKPFACRYCDKRFRHKSTRNTHHRTHTGEKPYVCSYCGKTFIQNSNLTLHLRTHTGERPYSCSVCARSFSSGSALKTHERTHTGERPYSCPVCGKSFARMNMKVHMRLHTGERPHRCGACGNSYVTASRLRDHAKVHTGERPFECASCMKNFTSRSHLVKHIKAHQLGKRRTQQRKDTAQQRKETVIVQHVREHKQEEIVVETTGDEVYNTVTNKGIILEEAEAPLEVSGELQGDICINPSVVNFVNNDYSNDVNLVTVNEGGLSISSTSGVLEATTVKLYQVDQSLVQIHSSGGQVTISKITSKMTANF